jgi:hypothetical protein
MAAQINTLKKQVSGLTLQINALRSQLTDVKAQLGTARKDAAAAKSEADTTKGDLGALAATALCGTAIEFDLFHITWRVIDIIIAALGASPVFGTQTPADDHGACAAIGVTRTPAAVSSRGWTPQPLTNAFLAFTQK